MNPEGTYPGKIIAAWLERNDAQQSDDLVMAFDCALTAPDGTELEASPRHATTGKYGWSGKAVAKLLELDWPGGLRNIGDTVGREVQVKIKHNTSQRGTEYENAYIVTPPSREPATSEQIEAGLAKLEVEDADDSNIPF